MGGSGDETLNGGTENDNLFGEGGNDTLNGNDGADNLNGEAGNDILNGGFGNDGFFAGEGNDQLFGNGGNDQLNGDVGNDSVDGGFGNDDVFGGTGNDTLRGNDGNDQVIGGAGKDSLYGGKGSDRLTGVDPFIPELGLGKGEIDTFSGGVNNDIFVLGAELPDGTKAVFYNDGNAYIAGTQDYALISDFGFAGDGVTLGEDKIQLAGSQNSYSLGSSPSGLPSGTGIFFGDGTTGAVPELIGIVQGISLSALNLANSAQFTFV